MKLSNFFLSSAVSIFLLLVSGCSNSAEKELLGTWGTKVQENGVSMDMNFHFLQEGVYSVEMTLGFRGDILHDTTTGVWRIHKDSLFMGPSKDSAEPSIYTINHDSLLLVLNNDTMTFIKE